MATHYTIRLGYFSGSFFKGGEAEAWKILVDEVTRLREDQDEIRDAVYRVNDGFIPDLYDYIEAYSASRDDLTLRIDHERKCIVQVASGDRRVKEIVRRAFCRLVIEAMHKHGIEVCLEVA